MEKIFSTVIFLLANFHNLKKHKKQFKKMATKLHTKFLLAVALCSGLALSSSYYNNEYFKRIPRDEVNTYWTEEIDAHSFIKDTFSCELIQG